MWCIYAMGIVYDKVYGIVYGMVWYGRVGYAQCVGRVCNGVDE